MTRLVSTTKKVQETIVGLFSVTAAIVDEPKDALIYFPCYDRMYRDCELTFAGISQDHGWVWKTDDGLTVYDTDTFEVFYFDSMVGVQ